MTRPQQHSEPPAGPSEYPEGIPARPAMPGDRWRIWKDRTTGKWLAQPIGVGVYAIWPTTPGLPLLDRYRKKQYTAKTWAAALHFALMKQSTR